MKKLKSLELLEILCESVNMPSKEFMREVLDHKITQKIKGVMLLSIDKEGNNIFDGTKDIFIGDEISWEVKKRFAKETYELFKDVLKEFQGFIKIDEDSEPLEQFKNVTFEDADEDEIVNIGFVLKILITPEERLSIKMKKSLPLNNQVKVKRKKI